MEKKAAYENGKTIGRIMFIGDVILLVIAVLTPGKEENFAPAVKFGYTCVDESTGEETTDCLDVDEGASDSAELKF